MAGHGSMPFEHLFTKRCVQNCPKAICPTCPSGQECQLTSITCDECPKTVCVDSIPESTPSSSPGISGHGPSVGAIAGGVIGGVVAIAALTYLVWRFCVKNKRQQYEQENWGEDIDENSSAEKDFAMRRDARASTHTVGSIASTVLTRASNIIQIAYIPGVTNRSAPSTPGLLVPPVPPIPIALSPTSSTLRYEQEHFFMPGDLRDSTYSGISDRTSYARTSVASTIYGKNAVVSPVPAQTVIRGKAAVVSVKSNGGGTPGDMTPPVPSVDYSRFGNNGPASPAFSVGSTFLNSASAATATTVKPQIVRLVNAQKKDSAQSDTESEARQSSQPRDSNAITIIDDTPAIEQGPFSDREAVRRAQSGSSLSAVIEEATRKALSINSLKGDDKSAKDSDSRRTPFGDENEVKDT